MKYMDMHCDTVSGIYLDRLEGRENHLRENKGHLDLLRMKQGECFGQNFAIFTELKEGRDPYETAKGTLRVFREELEENGDLIRQASSIQELLDNEREGRMSAILTLEEGGICLGRTELLREFYEAGARMIPGTSRMSWPGRTGSIWRRESACRRRSMGSSQREWNSWS